MGKQVEASLEGQIQQPCKCPGHFAEREKTETGLPHQPAHEIADPVSKRNDPVLGVMGQPAMIASEIPEDRQHAEHLPASRPIQASGAAGLRREVSPAVRLTGSPFVRQDIDDGFSIELAQKSAIAVANRIGPVAVDDPVRDLGDAGSRRDIAAERGIGCSG